MDCPKCNSRLTQIDSASSGFSSLFVGYGASVLSELILWFVVAAIGIGCLYAELYLTAVVFSFAAIIGGYAFHKHSKNKGVTDAIYECIDCKSRFIGAQRKPFTYAHGPYPK